MKIKQLAFLLMIIIVETGWAQNPNLDYKSAIKIYNLTTFEDQVRSVGSSDTSSFYIQSTIRARQILHPTFAFQWKSKGNGFHEIELTSFILEKNQAKTENINDSTNYSQTISDGEWTTTAISARYEYIMNFNRSKESKLVPSVGFGINPYYRKNSYSPGISSSFPSSEMSVGARAFVTPRLTYFMTSKLFFDVNIPLCVIDNYIRTTNNNNPTIPENQRNISVFEFNQFPKYFSGRIGIGLKL